METERFFLRPVCAQDIEHIYAGLSDPGVTKYYGVSYASLAATEVQMNWYAALEQNDTGCWWVICEKNSQVFAGACGINDLKKDHQKAETGFWLLPAWWGKGVILEVLPPVIAYCFTVYSLHRLEAYVETANTNCKNVLQKLGFQHEGTLRDCEIKNGQFISLDIFAFIKTYNERG